MGHSPSERANVTLELEVITLPDIARGREIGSR